MHGGLKGEAEAVFGHGVLHTDWSWHARLHLLVPYL